jgi:protein gp37
MSDKTGIEWTDATWNPVTGCTKVSSGCDNCYAETFAERWRGTPGHHFENGFDVQLRPDKLDQPLKWKKPRKIFVNSMSDLFHQDVPDEYIARVFAVMAATPQHTYQLLTKRHGRMRSFLRDECRCGGGHAPGVHLRSEMDWVSTPHSPTYVPGIEPSLYHRITWPLPNVWMGVSAENQATANLRVPALLETPAETRFVSVEPMLGPVDLTKLQRRPDATAAIDALSGDVWSTTTGDIYAAAPGCIDWVIVGGESGRGARPMHPQWARDLRDQTIAAGRAFLFKQWGEWGPAPWKLAREEGESDDAYKARSNAEAATRSYAPWAHEYDHFVNEGHPAWGGERATSCGPHAPIRRWGKKRAGRELDGRTWDQYPQAVTR